MSAGEYDWAAARPFDQWSDTGPNICSRANRVILETWFSEGIVFGFHSFYCGGCSPNSAAFKKLETLMAEVNRSRQGDLFELWSLADVARRGLVLASGSVPAERPGGSLLTGDQLSRIREYLGQRFAEYFAIFELQSVPPTFSEERLSDQCLWADVNDADGYQYLEDNSRELALPGNSVWVIALTLLERSDGAKVNGKRPNAAGLVPLGGAY
jgi:hypothetical protein